MFYDQQTWLCEPCGCVQFSFFSVAAPEPTHFPQNAVKTRLKKKSLQNHFQQNVVNQTKTLKNQERKHAKKTAQQPQTSVNNAENKVCQLTSQTRMLSFVTCLALNNTHHLTNLAMLFKQVNNKNISILSNLCYQSWSSVYISSLNAVTHTCTLFVNKFSKKMGRQRTDSALSQWIHFSNRTHLPTLTKQIKDRSR